MRTLTLKIKQAKVLTFAEAYVDMFRGEETVKDINVSYTNGKGGILSNGQILYTSGTSGQVNSMKVTVLGDKVVTGSGILPIRITAYPNTLSPDTVLPITVLNSELKINLNYLSLPVIVDIVLDVQTREPFVIPANAFLAATSSFDNIPLKDVKLIGTLTRFTLNDLPIAADTWISITDIANSKLKYLPTEDIPAYDAVVNFVVRDTNNNQSN